MPRQQTLLLIALFASWIPSFGIAASSEDATQFFENRIRPLLAERCYECHNEDLQESGLRLDSLQAMIDGGERGPAIVPGNAKDSLLIHAVNHSEADLQMPEGDKLSAREIADLATWIREGAIWPGQQAEIRKSAEQDGPLFTDAERNFWAFVPPRTPVIPDVQNRNWAKSELDYFILAKLEAAGLEPAPPATKRSLLRRTYFDLIGLPPTPKQTEEFVRDNSPQSFERVVDDLLASPQYGERWGRHWLDVARYADSNGLDENWAFEFIYKYRDWVVQAFNDDLPYTDFVTQQLAGDLLKQQPHEDQNDYMRRVEATGFLSVGPKMIADDDPKKKKMDIIDEQLNTVGQTFMGLTIGCARCHDHKFDPIPTWDYYAMASIFKSTKTMEHLRVVAPVSLHEFEYEGYAEELKAYQTKLRELQSKRDDFWRQHGLATFKKQNPTKAKELEGKAFKLPKKPESYLDEADRTQFERLQDQLKQHEKNKPQKTKVMGPTEGEVENLRVSLRGNYLTLGDQTRRQFLRIIDGEQAEPITTDQSGRLELAQWIASPHNPLTARVFVNRVWRWRFGRGIVATTDNFGRLGARPSHPALLDYLALKFVEGGWSLKRLHKQMLLSSTYQMSSRYDQRGDEVDPQNLLWWRFPRRRLEAEAIRDSILSVSDNLDLTVGGSLMPLRDRTYVTGTASKQQRYDNPRRSIYQPVYRSAVYDVLSTFDFPDPATPTGDRKESVVAPQALVMMNSNLVATHAERLATKLLLDSASDETRIRRMFETILSRTPADHEVMAIRHHLAGARAPIKFTSDDGSNPSKTDEVSTEAELELSAWTGLCRTLISSNEFLYVD